MREEIEMKKFLISGVFSLMLAAAFSMPAFAEELIVGGQAVGIQISTEGVLVAGLSDVETVDGSASPARDAGIKQGDLIIKIDGQKVYDSATVIAAVEGAAEGKISLSIKRGEKYMSVDISPAESAEGKRMLGLLLRDGLSGIGTLTWLEPDSGSYGALGHSVNDSEAKSDVPIREGSITSAQIVSVRPGAPGDPGELNGAADLSRVLGSVEKNTDVGIFGKFYSSLDGQLMETGLVTAGPASLISTISGSEKRMYSVEINRVYKDAGSTHAMLTVTDPELLAKTGGIVQGMSGSPIIQNGKIVGAVTHVFVNEPSKGYAISIQDMLRAAGIEDKAA